MFNKVLLIGTVADKPRVHVFDNGERVVNFTLVTTERWTSGKTGEKKERNETHKIAIFNERIIDFVANSIDKGTYCYVEGSLENKRAGTMADGTPMKETASIVLRPGRGQITLMRDTEECTGDGVGR